MINSDAGAARKRINPKRFIADIKIGLGKPELGLKYGLSPNNVISAIEKLKASGRLKDEDLEPKTTYVIFNRNRTETLTMGKAMSRSELALKRLKEGMSLADADLQEVSFANRSLSAGDLERADLSHSDLAGADLTGMILAGASLIGVNLAGANLRACDLMGANLTGADLSGATITNCNLADVDLTGANLKNTEIRHCNAHGMNLTASLREGWQTEGMDLSVAIWDKPARDAAERREELDRLVYGPLKIAVLEVLVILLQVAAMRIQGPFMLFTLIGIVAVHAYYGFMKSGLWNLLGFLQACFCVFLWCRSA